MRANNHSKLVGLLIRMGLWSEEQGERAEMLVEDNPEQTSIDLWVQEGLLKPEDAPIVRDLRAREDVTGDRIETLKEAQTASEASCTSSLHISSVLAAIKAKGR